MKKWRVIIGVVAILLLIFFIQSNGRTTNLVNYPPQSGTIVAFGDSLVAGVGSNDTGGFVSLVAADINQPIINLGTPGDTTKSGLARINAVLAEEPSIVLLLLGGNDAIRRISKAETFANLEEIITTLQAHGTFVVVLGIQGGLIRDQYADDFEILTKRLGTGYIPNVLDEIIGNSRLMSDAIHPNQIGYQQIAARISPLLQEIVAVIP